MTNPIQTPGELRERIFKELKSLKTGLESDAHPDAKSNWCQETEDNLMALFSDLLTQVEAEGPEDMPEQEIGISRTYNASANGFNESNDQWRKTLATIRERMGI